MSDGEGCQLFRWWLWHWNMIRFFPRLCLRLDSWGALTHCNFVRGIFGPTRKVVNSERLRYVCGYFKVESEDLQPWH